MAIAPAITAPELPCWYCGGRDPEDGTPYDAADKSRSGAWLCEACEERARFRALLRKIEWSGDEGTCPDCHSLKSDGLHLSACGIDALIKGEVGAGSVPA